MTSEIDQSVSGRQQAITEQNFLLEDDPNCGIRNSGRDECFWNCVYEFEEGDIDDGNSLFQDPLCMEDCFPDSHCIGKLIKDYKLAGGVCIHSMFPGMPGIHVNKMSDFTA